MFKIASLLAAAVMLFACEKANTSGELKIISDKDVIQADGQDAAVIKVMFGTKDVTSSAVIYDQYDKEVVLVDGKFTASKAGEYKFCADYGAMSTYRKNDPDCYYVIKAINVAVPEAPADPQPENTSFVHRTFLTQYTGTGCGYCPYMIRILRGVMEEGYIPSKAVLAAVHSYGSSDPAFIAAPKVQNYPYLTLDLVQGFSHSGSTTEQLLALIDEHTAGAAKAGISVSPKYYEKEKLLVVKVAVKAAVAGTFNVGAWLLEDGIVGQQSDYDNVGDDTFDVHENCVRIADSRYSTTWFGHLLSEAEAGDVMEKTFVMDIKPDWNLDKLHLAVFASHGEVDGSRIAYTVCNAVDVPINKETPFEYAK